MPLTDHAPGVPLTYPDMGSYEPDDVTWLVRDLTQQIADSRWEGRGPLGPRNANLLAAEKLAPSEHDTWFLKNTARLAADLAVHAGVLAELSLARRGRRTVFASIIRAGVPVGVLLRRWLAFRHELDVPHYAISLVPGSGIDPVALDYLAENHDPRGVVFVDGWTGRGNIAVEVASCLEEHRATTGIAFSPDLAVLVDYSECSTLFGTRRDTLVPSACLSATATGLTSKTVLRDIWVEGGHFHGVARYPRFAPRDHSRWFVDRISAYFPDVVDHVDAVVEKRLAGPPPRATMRGRHAVDRLAGRHGIADPRRIKAGVGETTRMLLVNDVERLMVHPSAGSDVYPVLELAISRGIEVTWDPDLEFGCAGICAPLGRIG